MRPLAAALPLHPLGGAGREADSRDNTSDNRRQSGDGYRLCLRTASLVGPSPPANSLELGENPIGILV